MKHKNKRWQMQPAFKVGDVVDYHSIIGGEITSTGHVVESICELNGNPVVWISGKPGCVSERALSLHKNKPENDKELRKLIKGLSKEIRKGEPFDSGGYVC